MRTNSIGKKIPFFFLFWKIQNKILTFLYQHNQNWHKFKGNSDVPKWYLAMKKKEKEKEKENSYNTSSYTAPSNLCVVHSQSKIALEMDMIHRAGRVHTLVPITFPTSLAALQYTCKIESTQGSDSSFQSCLRFSSFFQVWMHVVFHEEKL